MPPRTSRKTVAKPVVKTVDHQRAAHSASLIMLWVTLFAVSFGLALGFLGIWTQQEELSARLDALENRVLSLEPPSPQIVPLPPVPATTSTSPVVTTPNVSPLLVRGSLSPDGTKYAGYDTVTKGKMGVAVETLADQKIRHIVIFNPYSESTGINHPEESELSVRWKDAQTIEYDLLVKQGNQWVKKPDTVKIFF